MIPSIIANPQYWRERAEHVRAMADQMEDSDHKRAMAEIAMRYDVLAERAECLKAAKSRSFTDFHP
jgi:hypothetical protein